MNVLAHHSINANRHWAPLPPFDGAPATPAGRRLARRYHLSPSLAEALAALAGFMATREVR